jgi:hypothetical protein
VNELSLREGFRLLSSYPVCACPDKNCDEQRVWVITDAARNQRPCDNDLAARQLLI